MTKDKTTVHIEKDMLDQFKREAVHIVGQDLFISASKALEIVLKEYQKISKEK